MADEHQEVNNVEKRSLALEDRIVAAHTNLSRKQKKIARFILENQEFVAFFSANELGAKTRSSAATVVRLCQALGYEGYIHLQLAVREGISFQRTAVQRLQDRLADHDQNQDVLARVFATDIHNIERTVGLLSGDRLEAAVAEMLRARRILVVGDGLAAGLVAFFTHALQVIGLPAQSVVGGGEALAMRLAFLQAEDLVIGLGFWRNLRDVVQAIELAKDIGATTIGMTDNRLSPLAVLPDYSFLVTTDGVAHSLSPAAMVSLLNAFIAALSFEMPEQVVRSLSRVDEAYQRIDLLTES